MLVYTNFESLDVYGICVVFKLIQEVAFRSGLSQDPVTFFPILYGYRRCLWSFWERRLSYSEMNAYQDTLFNKDCSFVKGKLNLSRCLTFPVIPDKLLY